MSIDKAEKILKNYKKLHKEYQRIQREISRTIIKAGPAVPTSAWLDPSGASKSASETTLIVIERIQELVNERDIIRAEMDGIDILLAEISKDKGCELYGDVLRMWYIEELPKWEIAIIAGYSSRQSIYLICNNALMKLSKLL